MDAESLKTGTELKIKGTETVECRITDVSMQPITVDDTFDEYTIHVGGLQQGEWVYVVETDGTISDGIYAADIVIDSVALRVFVLN